MSRMTAPVGDVTTPMTLGRYGIGRLRARQDFQQRRLAGAILAEQGMNLAGGDFQMHAFQRFHAGKLLGDASHLQDRRGRSLISRR